MGEEKQETFAPGWIVRRTIFTCCEVFVDILCFSMRHFLISRSSVHVRLSSGNSPLDHLVSKNHRKKGDPSYQWLFLVPLNDGRDYITPQKAIYKWYISGIYCQLGDYMPPTTF